MGRHNSSFDTMAKAMKAMKAMAAMKVMKKKRVSKVCSRAKVFHGTKVKSTGGLTKSDLTKNSSGKIVSKKASAAAKKKLGGWISAVQKARKSLGLKGFVAINKGSALYKKAKELYQ